MDSLEETILRAIANRPDAAELLASDHLGDVLNDGITQAMEDCGGRLADLLRLDAPEMLREHREYEDAFRERLRSIWGKSLDLYEALLVACTECGQKFNADHREQAAAQDDYLLEALTR